MRALCSLPGGIGRFVPCRIGANHCRLRHFGYEKCGHGLTSRPRETAGVTFLAECLFYFGTVLALLEGTLPFSCCAVRFASKIPAWRLPLAHGVASLVTGGGEEVGMVRVEPCVRAGAPCSHDCTGADLVRGPGGSGKRVRLNRKRSCTPCAWKRLRVPGSQEWEHVDGKRRNVYQHADGAQPAHDWVGVG